MPSSSVCPFLHWEIEANAKDNAKDNVKDNSKDNANANAKDNAKDNAKTKVKTTREKLLKLSLCANAGSFGFTGMLDI